MRRVVIWAEFGPNCDYKVLAEAGPMDDIARKQALLDFLASEAREYKPAEYVRQMLEEKPGRKERGARLATLFANESDREELLVTMHDLLTEWREYAYLLGMRQGYAIAKGLAKWGKKGKREQKAIAKMTQVLMENPKARNNQICDALDQDKIELLKLKGKPKDAECWWEVVKVQSYKNLIYRVRKQVAKNTRRRDWEEMILIFNSDGIKADVLLDVDPS